MPMYDLVSYLYPSSEGGNSGRRIPGPTAGPRAHPGRHPRRRHPRVRRPRLQRRPCRRDRHQDPHDQADALLLLRQQGAALHRRAGARLPADAHFRVDPGGGRARPGGRDPADRRADLRPPPVASRLHPAGQHREHQPGRAHGEVGDVPRPERLRGVPDRTDPRPGPRPGPVPTGGRRARRAHADQLLLRVPGRQPPHLQDDLRTRPHRPRPARPLPEDAGRPRGGLPDRARRPLSQPQSTASPPGGTMAFTRPTTDPGSIRAPVTLDLPEPAPLRRMLGPGIIAVGIGMAAGELILWPYITALAGFGLLWLALATLAVQFVINMEIERYTLATGQTVVTGLARWWKGWGIFICLAGAFQYAWPGWATSASTVLTYALGGGSVTWITIAALVLIGIVLTTSPSSMAPSRRSSG